MPSAGETIIAGRIPGERIATNIETSDSGSISTTETVVMSVTAPVVEGRTYRVKAVFNVDGTVSNDTFVARLREDSVSGAQLQVDRVDLTNPSTNLAAVPLEVEYTADATEDKTFVLCFIRSTGTGSMILAAAGNAPSYLYVDYIRG